MHSVSVWLECGLMQRPQAGYVLELQCSYTLMGAQKEATQAVCRRRLGYSRHDAECTSENLLRQSFLNVRPQLKACIVATNCDVLNVQAIGMEPCTAMCTVHVHALQPQMTFQSIKRAVVRSPRLQLLTYHLFVSRTGDHHFAPSVTGIAVKSAHPRRSANTGTALVLH